MHSDKESANVKERYNACIKSKSPDEIKTCHKNIHSHKETPQRKECGIVAAIAFIDDRKTQNIC